MGNESSPQGTLLVGLPGGSAMAGEIERVIQLVRERHDLNIVMDLSEAGAPNSSCLADMLRLRRLLRENRRRLILSNLGVATEAVFTVSGLNATFEIVRDRLDALAAIQTRPDDKPEYFRPDENTGQLPLSRAIGAGR